MIVVEIPIIVAHADVAAGGRHVEGEGCSGGT